MYRHIGLSASSQFISNIHICMQKLLLYLTLRSITINLLRLDISYKTQQNTALTQTFL